MAKRPAKTNSQGSLSAIAPAIIALSIIAEKGGEAGAMFNREGLQQHLDNGFVEIDESVFNDAGEVLARLTPLGFEELEKQKHSAPVSQKTEHAGGFAIKAFEIPKAGTRASHGRTSIYPFDSLEPGQAFFVPATAEKPNPYKSMASTVVGANARYAEETGEFETKVRRSFLRDAETGEFVTDEHGKRVFGNEEEYQAPITKQIREFGVTALNDGEQFGPEFKGVKGAAVFRRF